MDVASFTVSNELKTSRFLTDDLSERWVEKNGVFALGWAFTSTGENLDGAGLCQWVLNRVERLDRFGDELRTLNGSFAIAGVTESGSFAAVDRLRSIPIFFAERDGQLLLSDSAARLGAGSNPKRSRIAEVEFVAVGYVTGPDTLYPGVKQLQAGQYLFATNDSSPRIQYYYRHLHGNFDTRPREELFESLAGIDERVAERLLRSTESSTLLLPLSGGYDSRYIACLLKRYARANTKVQCFTYGRADSAEVLRAMRVARELNFPIEFIEYSDAKWEAFFHSEDARKYFEFASAGAASPHIQDYIALSELRARGLLDAKTTVVPGFCGDVLGGSFIPMTIVRGESEELRRRGLPQFLYERFFAPMVDSLFAEERERIVQRLENSIENESWKGVLNEEEFVSAVDEWVTRHRLARFIINAVRVFEYFGLQWRMPLWDNELVEFWYRMPVASRRKNALYNDYLLNAVFAPLKVNFPRPVDSPSRRLYLSLLDRAPGVYRIARKTMHHLKGRKSEVETNNGFDALAEILKQELAARGIALDSPDINHYFAQWFLLQDHAAGCEAAAIKERERCHQSH